MGSLCVRRVNSFNILVKSAFKSNFFWAFAQRSGFGAAISDAVARSSFGFCNRSLQIALSWLRQGCLAPRLPAQYY